MEETIITSKKFWLGKRDFIKAAIMAILSTPVTMILGTLSAWASAPDAPLVIDWVLMGKVAVASAVTYLTKNFFEPTKQITIQK